MAYLIFNNICFSGRLKRKGPADRAYERKQYCNGVGSDAKGRSFLAGITWAGQHGESAASADHSMQSTQNTDSVDGFVRPLGDSVSVAWSKSLQAEGSRKVLDETQMADGRVRQLQNHSTDVVVDDRTTERIPVGVQQTQPLSSRSAIDRNRGYASLRSTIHEQPFYHTRSFQNSGGEATACVRSRTPWNVMDQSHRTEQLVTHRPDVGEVNRDGYPTPPLLWTTDSPVVQSNNELFSGITYHRFSAPLDDTGETLPSSIGCWSDTEMMMENWFDANPSSVSFGSVDRSQLNSNYCQTTAHTFHF